MNVTVEGVITSIEQKAKDDKKFTEILLAQKGQKTQVTVRLNGHQEANYDLFEVQSFNGRLMTWEHRGNIGSMVMVQDSQ